MVPTTTTTICIFYVSKYITNIPDSNLYCALYTTRVYSPSSIYTIIESTLQVK